MMPSDSISSDQITLGDVWNHYEALRDIVTREAEEARRSLTSGMAPRNSELLSMDVDEMDAHFEGILEEIDIQSSLFILAATEATVRVDFLARVYEKRRDTVSRTFRDIYKSRCDHNKIKVRLEEDILDTWGEQLPDSKSDVGRLKGAFKYRHWLAHGRYWVPKLGQRYDPSGLFLLIDGFFVKTGLSNQ